MAKSRQKTARTTIALRAVGVLVVIGLIILAWATNRRLLVLRQKFERNLPDKMNYNDIALNGVIMPIHFEEVDTGKQLATYGDKLPKVLESIDVWQNVECMRPAINNNNLRERILKGNSNNPSLPLLLKTMDTLEDHVYKVSATVADSFKQDGKMVANKYSLNYNEICETDSHFIFLYNLGQVISQKPGIVPAAYAGGTSLDEDTMALVNKKTGEATIIERLIKQINLRRMGPYLGCSHLVGSTANQLLIACSGGDGPIYTHSLVFYNMEKNSFAEIANCGSHVLENGDGYENCHDQYGKQYFYLKTHL